MTWTELARSAECYVLCSVYVFTFIVYVAFHVGDVVG